MSGKFEWPSGFNQEINRLSREPKEAAPEAAIDTEHRLDVCPFCGEVPEEVHTNDLRGFYVGCANEQCSVQPETGLQRSEEVARKEWNWKSEPATEGAPDTALTGEQIYSTCNHDPACGCDICNQIRIVELAAEKPVEWCHYHNGPFKEVCPLGGRCERKEDWGKALAQPKSEGTEKAPNNHGLIEYFPEDCTHDELVVKLSDADTLFHALESRNAELQKEVEKANSAREHTQNWYASHYGKLEDWARKILPEQWRRQFFNCVANGTYDHDDVGIAYICKAGFRVVPSGYIHMEDAKGQLVLDQTQRAENSEREVERLTQLGREFAWGEGENASQTISKLEGQYEEQKKIVSRIWTVLGNPTYAELNGRSIYDLISELQADAQKRTEGMPEPVVDDETIKMYVKDAKRVLPMATKMALEIQQWRAWAAGRGDR